jgi:two-component system, sensor histidine kinase
MLCILIVDSSPDAADALGQLCEARGHEVDYAYDAASALDAARRLKPDLLFVDPLLEDVAKLVEQVQREPTLRAMSIELLARPLDMDRVDALLQRKISPRP